MPPVRCNRFRITPFWMAALGVGHNGSRQVSQLRKTQLKRLQW
ncbi:MAG: hypothetical protein NTZ40_01720 [Cyanobacteria bacterium]|nr:hypothetical protein [Cyanobacteriota bacterium]